MAHSLVTFQLGKQSYALPVEQVIEMLQMVAAKELPDLPPGVLGVINYRGKVIPLLDLRQLFGITPRKIRLNTPLLVVQTPSQSYFALLIDQVLGVQELELEPLDLIKYAEFNRNLLRNLAKSSTDELIFVVDLAALELRLDRAS